MKKIIIVLFVIASACWAVPKPMESIENYNVMMVHGAYSACQGFWIERDSTSCEDFLMESDTNEAYYADGTLENGATLGAYDNENRITNWVSTVILEERGWKDKNIYARNSYVYNWRSFSNPANTSLNNAHELGDRTWSLKGTRFKQRRALFEEAQELKANWYDAKNDSMHMGQDALEIIRKNPDLYRQLASRYILIGHSMGGIVSREYVQGNFYNGDVDKIITLDSPHEGTSALNMLVSKRLDDDFWAHTKDNIESSIPSAIPMLLSLDAVGVGYAILVIAINTVLQELGDLVATGVIWTNDALSYYSVDPLVHYVDPNQRGFQTIDSLNRLPYVADSLPMFRILASQHGMTYTSIEDIDKCIENADVGFAHNINDAIIDNGRLPLFNYAAQKAGTGDFSARYVNALAAHVMGYAGIPIMTTGSSIIPAKSSEGKDVNVLNDENVDIKRVYYNAAPNASGTLGDVAAVFDEAVNAIVAIDNTLDYFFPGVVDGIKIAMGFAAGSVQEGLSLTAALGLGFMDIKQSHQMSIDTDFKDWMLKDSVHLYEDFLYERPFVNLALNDIHTLDMLSRMRADSSESSTLNRNCYYIGSKSGKTCAVGLFRYQTNLNSFQQEQSLSALTPLHFKSESDWSKMGVKVDRWEMVDGLHPDGSLNKKGVPIRHVERYVVPDNIVAQDFIEKYSFVIDDLMPHRMRKIYMNFNFQQELAWECDIEKDPASSLFARTAVTSLHEIS